MPLKKKGEAASVKRHRLKCMFPISRTPMKNLLATELEFNSNLEVSSQLLNNLKSIFMKLLITWDRKNAHTKFPNSFLWASYTAISRWWWNRKLVSALCTLKSLKGQKKKGVEQKAEKNKAHNTARDLIINLNHIKSPRLHPDGSQTRLMLLHSARLIEHPPWWKRFRSSTRGPPHALVCSMAQIPRHPIRKCCIWAGTRP